MEEKEDLMVKQYGGYEDDAELPALYDSIPLYASRRDVRFYVDLCRQASGDVLEAGCGTGRILIPAPRKAARSRDWIPRSSCLSAAGPRWTFYRPKWEAAFGWRSAI